MLVCRCFVGLGVGGIPQTIALITEMVPTRRRSQAVLLLAVFWGLGTMFAAALALAVVNTWSWRWYLLLLPSPVAVFLVASWWIPESPRYLLITGQMVRLNSLMKRIAKTNKKDVPNDVVHRVIVPSRGRISDLFTGRFRGTTILLGGMWFAVSFGYFGVALLTTQMLQSGVDGCTNHHNLTNLTNLTNQTSSVSVSKSVQRTQASTLTTRGKLLRKIPCRSQEKSPKNPKDSQCNTKNIPNPVRPSKKLFTPRLTARYKSFP